MEMNLKIYNTLTQKKETFTPIKDNQVGMYVCGITVYDYCHLGHARAYVAFDVIYRFLMALGYQVTYVRNITDIDDKIIKRANERGIGCDQLTQDYIEFMHEDFEALGLLKPQHEPRATEYIPQMIEMVQILEAKGIAYAAGNGDVYYDISQFEGYGKLSHKDIEGLEAGSRVEADQHKKNPLDFVLWKAEKPGEPAWDSPWGRGRPGWHLECSAMSSTLLGQQFDIHGGGADLQFPHHENEIAQSEGTHNCDMVNTWMHVGYLQVDNEKMSKSLNNFFTIRDVLKEYPAEVVRYFLLSSHYRSQLNFSEDNLKAAKSALTRLYQSLVGVTNYKYEAILSDEKNAFLEAMQDDFNTPEALAVLFDLSNRLNQAKQQALDDASALSATLVHLAGILGLLQRKPEEFLQGGQDESDAKVIEQLIEDRKIARQNKDWDQADAIRDKLLAMGVEILDGAEGTTWRKV